MKRNVIHSKMLLFFLLLFIFLLCLFFLNGSPSANPERRGHPITHASSRLDNHTLLSDGYQFLAEEWENASTLHSILNQLSVNQFIFNNLYSREKLEKFTLFSLISFGFLLGCLVLAWHLHKMLRHEKRLKGELHDMVKKFSHVLKHAPDGMVLLKQDNTVLNINQSACQILNTSEQQASHQEITALVNDPEASNKLAGLLSQVHGKMNQGDNQPVSQQITINTTSVQHLEIIASETAYNDGNEILLNIRDVTVWVDREEKLKSLSRALEQSDDSIIITNEKGIIEYVNHSFEKYNELDANELIGSDAAHLILTALQNPAELAKLQQQLVKGQTINRIISHRKKDNSLVYMEKRISPIRNNLGKISHYITTGKDITDRVLFESKLKQLAHFDILTQLPNRLMLQQQIDHLLQQSPCPVIGLLTLNLDRFKQINDSLGHDTGDQVLLAVSERLQTILRENDMLARLGSDEFAILVASDNRLPALEHLAERILRHLSEPMTLGSKEVVVGASIGITYSDSIHSTSETLLRQADIALYKAKDNKQQQQYRVYNRQMGANSVKRLEMEAQLRQSCGTDRYQYYYQGRFDSRTRQLCGAEALLRWVDDDNRIQSPTEFIPILETTGLIIEVGEHLIQQACKQLRQWQLQGHWLHFALNISARQLLNSDIVSTVSKAIQNSQCDPSFLELEITESVVMSDVKLALNKLRQINALGVRIAIDDFGTGYSSLAYLSRFPIQILKVDREFVRDLPLNKESVTITNAIVELAHNLNISVVAEGVETKGQADFLASIGVEEFQGFLYCKPLPLSDFETRFLLPVQNTKEHSTY
ncbi:EAL domain-containing protein [Photobacterium sp. WH24]|uniref:EAL domain-containing protein n=1 Tax=Photobacterium arenosum TaxID=2774143 RepID=A0ABR9BQY2_9GAMM|nr:MULTISPECIES: bifunctional diguanylate cyclase/phosphodiesterase [Photobacterium]MBD8513891.1 EAL domain-containing protein [Photobacterium arenosum]MBV7262467.1 EAL domain-containing protein [Photobacterium sp. WH24]